MSDDGSARTLTEADKEWLRDQHRKDIMDKREQAIHARQRYADLAADDDLDREFHGDLFVAVEQYRMILRPYRNEDVLDADDWPDMGDAVSRLAEVDKHIADMGPELSPERLAEYCDELEAVAEKLGFAGRPGL